MNILWKILLFAQLCDCNNKYLSPFMQIYVKFPRKSTHFIETMQINLHISEFFCTFARQMRAVEI